MRLHHKRNCPRHVERIIFTGPSPHWVPSLPSVVARMLPNVPERTFVGIDKGVLELDRKLKQDVMNSKDVEYVSLIDYFCTFDGCLLRYASDVAASVTSWDYGHLAPMASYHLAKDLLVPAIIRD